MARILPVKINKKPMNKTIIAIAFLLISLNSFSQKEDVYKKWFSAEQLDCKGTTQSVSSNLKWSIEFKNNQTAEIILNNGKVVNTQNFRIDGDCIKLDFREFIIEKLYKDSLVLTEENASSCNKYVMISGALKALHQKEKFVISNSDTLYYPEFGNAPILKGFNDYTTFFIKEFARKMQGSSKACQITYRFIITKNGEIKRPNVHASIDKKYEKFLLKILDRTKNKWTPMYLFNKPVNTIVKFKFKYQKG